MRQLVHGLALIALAGTAQAQEWQPLDGVGITQALSDRQVIYDNDATQQFYASGRTLYTHGEPSWGSWRVEADQYCSLWPPSPSWDCYAVESDGAGGINFRDEWGNTFPGAIVPE